MYRNVELGAFSGIQYCTTGADHERDELEELEIMKKEECFFNIHVPSVNGITIVTFVNPDWMPLLQNWLCSLRKQGLGGGVLVVAFGSSVCQNLVGVACHHVNETYPASSYGQAGYREMLKHRTRIILKLLGCGYTLLLSDVDVVFLKNPLPTLFKESKEKDIIFQGDSIDHNLVDSLLPYTISYACVGFTFMKPTTGTILLWKGVLNYQTHHYWNDQAAVNVCLRHPSILAHLRWAVLDYWQFPNGIIYFKQRTHLQNPFIVHANFLLGINNKMAEMMAAGLWCVEEAFSSHCHKLYQFGCVQRLPPKSWCRSLVSECAKRGIRF